MQIKKFIAPTLKEASEQMKEEFGGEAVILSTRVIENDRRFNRKRMYELTAGIEQFNSEPEIELSLTENSMNSISAVKTRSFAEELQELSNRIYNPKPQEELIKKEHDFLSKNNVDSKDKQISNIVKNLVENLFNLEVQKPIISLIVEQLKKNKNFLNSSNLDSYVLSIIASLIPTYNFEVQKGKKPKIVSLVGPTGVGKTTCIAKLALISKILHNLDIGLISIDTYRLGAIDQLKIFAEISNVELKVAYEPKEMLELINSLKKKDIIFIDTAGRSQKNSNSLTKTSEFLSAVKADETYLVLNSAASTKNLFDVIEKFKVFNYKSIIFTKIDEAVTFGNLLNVAVKFKTPISFLTNGQVIPDDIISADAEFIANMVYTGKINK